METANKVVSGETGAGAHAPELDARTVDPRKLARTLLRLCTGKRVSLDDHEPWLPPAAYGRGPALAR